MIITAAGPAILVLAAALCLLAGLELRSGVRRRSLKHSLGLRTGRGMRPVLAAEARRLLRHMPEEWVSAERERLGKAGLRPEPETGLTIRLASAVSCGVAGAFLWARVSPPGSGRLSFLTAASALVGLLAVDWWLAARAKSRILVLRADWPDFLDQLRLCLTAGMALEQALATLSTYPDPRRSPVLKTQLAELTARIRAGTSAERALDALARDTGLEEVEAFATSVGRSRALGVPLVETISRQAELCRARLRHEYLAWLNSLPSRLSLCAMVFFLPAVLAVVLVPNVVAFLRSGW